MFYKLPVVKLELIAGLCNSQNKVFFSLNVIAFCLNLPFKQIVKYSIITVKHGIEYPSLPV